MMLFQIDYAKHECLLMRCKASLNRPMEIVLISHVELIGLRVTDMFTSTFRGPGRKNSKLAYDGFRTHGNTPYATRNRPPRCTFISHSSAKSVPIFDGRCMTTLNPLDLSVFDRSMADTIPGEPPVFIST